MGGDYGLQKLFGTFGAIIWGPISGKIIGKMIFILIIAAKLTNSSIWNKYLHKHLNFSLRKLSLLHHQIAKIFGLKIWVCAKEINKVKLF